MRQAPPKDTVTSACGCGSVSLQESQTYDNRGGKYSGASSLPWHLLTGIRKIDFLEPTLVILGSRGRNALKG